MSDKPRCWACAHWHKLGTDHGLCKRYPPAWTFAHEVGRWDFPNTHGTDGCGEWKSTA
jgi:hypothetical protein